MSPSIGGDRSSHAMRAAAWTAAMFAALAGLAAKASTLYGSSGVVGSPPFYTIDQGTGIPTLLGPSGFTSLDNMASDWRAASYRLWAIDDSSNNRLLSVNPATGAATAIGSFNLPAINNLAFDVVTGQMYATNLTNLYRVNPDTAQLTFVGNTGRSGMYSLGFDLTGNLFGVTYPDNVLVRVSTSTGIATTIGPTGVGVMVDIACRPEDGVMFGVTTFNDFSLFRVNTATGAATPVGPYGLSGGINGLAFSPVPSPPAFALLGLGMLRMGRRRRGSR